MSEIMKKIIEVDGDVVVLGDLQPSNFFNIVGYEKCIEDLRKKLQNGAEVVVLIGDLIENMDMYYQQSFLTFDLKRQHVFIKYLINQLLEATKARKIVFIAGNHDTARGGEDVSMLLAEYYKLKGYETFWSDEFIILANDYKTYLMAHKISNAYGSSHVALTPLIRSSAFQFSRWIAEKTMKKVGKLKYGLLIDTVILGHIHRSAWRFDSMNIITLSGWNRHRWTIIEPSTCLILYSDGKEEVLQYPPPIDLTKNEIKMQQWVNEIFQNYIKQLTQTKIEEIRQTTNNNNGNDHDDKPQNENNKSGGDFDENPFKNFVQKQYEKYAKNDIEESFRELPWHIEKNSEKPKIVFSARNEIPLIVLQQALRKFGIETVLDEDRFKLELKEEGIIKLLQTGIDEKIKRRIIFELGKLGS